MDKSDTKELFSGTSTEAVSSSGEVSLSNTPSPTVNYSREATKQLMETMRGTKKLNNALQWISHEGSVIMSALAAVAGESGTLIQLSKLPEDDQLIIRDVLGDSIYGASSAAVHIFFNLDEHKNFECDIPVANAKSPRIKFILGNRVASIPPDEALYGKSDVKIEQKGGDIIIGDRIKLEKNKIQNSIQPVESVSSVSPPHSDARPKQKVSGRNAYEIRADVLEMALDFVKFLNKKGTSSDDVLDVADAFYEFVEHK